MSTFWKVCLLTALVVTAGCGGSDGGGSDAVLDDGQRNDASSLRGRLLMSNVGNKARIIDLSTGNVSSVPGVQEFGDPSGRSYASMWKAYAHAQPYSGDRFVLTVDSCKFDGNDNSTFTSLDHCLALHAAAGTELAVKKFYGSSGEIRGSAQLSFDGNYIAAVIDNNWVIIYDDQFNVVSRSKAPRSVIRGVVWRPDNSLLFYDKDEIFKTEVLNTVGTRILKVDPEGTGLLATLKVSPDGETLAFAFEGELHLMSLSTGNVRLVPVVEQLRLLWCNVTSWSPDGQSLMLYAKGTGLVITWGSHRIFGENIVIPVNFAQTGPDGKPVHQFEQVMAKANVWQLSGNTNETAPLEVLDENSHSYWLR